MSVCLCYIVEAVVLLVASANGEILGATLRALPNLKWIQGVVSNSVLVCVCVYACLSVCMSICVCVYMSICVCVCMSVYLSVCMHV